MNHVILTGRLTADPEVRYTKSEKAVASFTLAVDRIVAKGAEKQADFIHCVAWNQTAEAVGNYLSKGSKTLVEGRIQVRTYEKDDGKKVWVTEVVAQHVEFLERKKEVEHQEQQEEKAPDDVNSFGKDVFPGEEIPF